ncbi:hydrophobic surface binding protein [Mycena floridula]|nr:hydrophobic surface binding protein [Mycena floridula]
MVSFKLLFTLCAAILALATPLKRTVAQVESDLNNIHTQVSNLDTALTGFPASGLAGALGVHTDATNLNTAVQSATTDTTATATFSEADGNTILGLVNTITPIISDVLNQLVAKKASFQALPLGGVPALVLQDLKNLNGSTILFANALIARAPADLVSASNQIKSSLLSAFATAIAAYS